MEVKRICKKCGEVNTIDSSNLIRKNVFDEDGKSYQIMYYDCKRCNERAVVQIDDAESLMIFRDLKKLINKAMKKRIKRETISPKDVKKKDKLMKRLKDKRNILNEICKGKKLIDENEKIIIEHLTISGVGDIIESNL